jgi:hypothetical protein
VVEQSDNLARLRADSRELREAMAADIDALAESGTRDELERWCFTYGHLFGFEIIGADEQWIYRRLLRCALRNGLLADQLRDLIAGRPVGP